MSSTPQVEPPEEPADQSEHPSQAEGEDTDREDRHPDPQRRRPSQSEGEDDGRSAG
ncbi:hypothetical protein [Microbacterium sp.]|uniref:hypothetical protein n=1 Tax=Microbacterium sp. TaxID=51671 RepID=UPI0028124354|nr:hypothetical protein [Microbacterium sp.]